MNNNLGALIFAALITFYLSVANVKSMRSRIIGGRNVSDNEIKYIVSIKCGKFSCGGGIIDDTLIITAAHCVHLNKTTGTLLQPMRVLAATNTLVNYDKNKTIVIDVARAFLPAVYSKKGVDDIAILELAESLELDKNKDKLQKLLLPIPSELDDTYPTYDNVKFKFAGYGRSHIDMEIDENATIHYYPTSGGRLKVANATVIDKETCKNSWDFEISDKRICISITEDETKETHQGTRRGDSGSPAVIDDKFIIAIDSIGNNRCDNNYKPSIFTRVSSYIDFVKNIMKGDTNGAVIYSV